jgi:hypothetical protein
LAFNKQFSTSHSNDTNKVIDTQGTSRLSSFVYIETHPRRNAAFASRMNLRDAAHANSFKSFNPFTFKGFPTLLRNRRPTTLFFSIDSALFLSPWGCTPLFTSHSCAKNALRERKNCALLRTNSFVCHTCAFHGGRGEGSCTANLPLMYPVPCFSTGSHLHALERHTCTHRREVQ